MTCTYFRIIIHSTAYHHLKITWLGYFGSENQGLPLRSWFVTCWLWRHIPIVTSLAVPSSCVVTQTPMGTNSGTRRRKRKFLLLFVNCDRGRIEIDHLYGLCCRGWYCNPEQHSLCRPARPQAAARRPAQLVLFRIAVPTTPAQTLSWSIPITNLEDTVHARECLKNKSLSIWTAVILSGVYKENYIQNNSRRFAGDIIKCFSVEIGGISINISTVFIKCLFENESKFCGLIAWRRIGVKPLT